jgi:hypothetical protein
MAMEHETTPPPPNMKLDTNESYVLEVAAFLFPINVR